MPGNTRPVQTHICQQTLIKALRVAGMATNARGAIVSRRTNSVLSLGRNTPGKNEHSNNTCECDMERSNKCHATVTAWLLAPRSRPQLSLNHKKEAVTLRSEEHCKEMIRECADLMWGLESLCSEGREEGLCCDVKAGKPGVMSHATACEHLPGSCRGRQTSSRAPNSLVQKFPEESPVRPS